MSGTVTNLVQGAGVLYVADFGATEPNDSDVATPPASGTFTDVGFTMDGVTLNIEQEYSDLAADQMVDKPGTRLVSRNFVLSTNLAEPTLDNLALALNNTAPVTAAGVETLEPDAYDGGEPTYRALIFDGYAPGGFARRVIVRRALMTANIEMAYQKDNQTLIPVEFTAYYVSSSVAAYKVIDATS